MPAKVRIPPMEVLLHLQSAQLFAELGPATLAALASYVRTFAFARGETIIRAAEPVRSLHLVIEGRVRTTGIDQTPMVFGPGEIFGALLLLAQAPAGIDAVADAGTVTLELGADALIDVLEDHPVMLEHFLGILCRLMITQRSRIPGNAGFEEPVDDIVCPARPLDLVERIIVLRRALPLAQASIDALAELARHMDEVRLGPGELLWEVGAAADALLIPVCGAVACTTATGQAFRVGAGTIVGVLDALAAAPRWCQTRTDHELVALRVATEDFLDMLDDEIVLAIALLTAVAKESLQLVGRNQAAKWASEPRAGEGAPKVAAGGFELPPV